MPMESKSVREIVRRAVAQGTALQAGDLRRLKARSEQAVTLCKTVFWVGIVLFNLALWVPLPFRVEPAVLIGVAVVSLAVAIVVPIIGLKRHQLNLEMLKAAPQAPKKKTADEAGRRYIDQVRKQGRDFVAAEFERIEGSKWSAREARD